jgi:exonuclease SbcC
MLRTLTESASALGKIRAELSARVARSTRLSKDSDRLKSQRISLELKLARANLARAKLELFIDNVQEIRRRLSDHIEELLQEFVMVHTKDAFEDLFRRLARNPLFRVTISDVRMRYHKPEVDWRATYGGRIYPGEGVFSQGELNACAVAFFLSLATTHPRSLGILLLDDPVQNMDEIHIEEFGQILKHIKDELGWQILIGLHDESVFTYFKRQLYPSRTGQSAISYVIENDRNGATVNKDQEFRFDPKAFYNSRVA